jgi:malonyl CoA-acyl carrier protein transacylase
MLTVYAFAGQGSQRPGMGNGLLERHRDMTEVADTVLGTSLTALCRATDGRLDRTENTQPALFAVNALAYREAIERSGLAPTHLIGHSLGELNALHAAGVFGFEEGMRIVRRRAELMAQAPAGGMAAVVGDREDALALVAACDPAVTLALENSPRQLTVGGPRDAVEDLVRRAAGDPRVQVMPLPVSGAFHTPLMSEARDAFARWLESRTFARPTVPVISNVTARPYPPDGVAELLADLLVRPVRWLDCVRSLLAEGPVVFREIAPRPVLTGLLREIVAADAAPA